MDARLHMYFDRMAEIIRILQIQGNIKQKDIDSILYDGECEAHSLLRNQIPELITEDQCIKNLGLQDLTEKFFEAIDYLVKEKVKNVLTLLLYFLDRGIIDCYRRNIDFEEDVEIFDALNSNVDECQIILLRKAECRWAFREKRDGFQTLLYYFYFIDQNKIEDMHLKNYFLDESVIFNHGKAGLKIAISPITGHKVVNFSEPYERTNDRTGGLQSYFRVENLMMEEQITRQVLENIYLAGMNEADILVFPEMLGTSDMLKTVMGILAESRDKSVPPLVVFPSIWEKTEGDKNNTNRSCLILQGEEILFEQHKRCDFMYHSERGPVYEDINRYESEGNTLNLLHVEGIGRICIIICVDYLITENREQIVKNLCPTLVCSPSFSTGSFHFRTLGEAYFYQGCNWIWCNTCSAAHETTKEENFKSVGIITTLCKMNDLDDESSFKKQFPGKTDCKRSSCRNCIYYAEIPLSLDIHDLSKEGD